MFSGDIKSDDVVLVSLLLTLNRFGILFFCFYYWLWTSRCQTGCHFKHLLIFILKAADFLDSLFPLVDNRFPLADNRREICIQKIFLRKVLSYLIICIYRYFFGKNLREAGAANRGVLYEDVFLEISQNSQENTSARVSFLIKL